MQTRIQLEVVSDITVLSTVLEWFEPFQQVHLPQHIGLQGNLALAEGFTNAVQHAHRSLSPRTPIRLKAEVSKDFFQFEIWDQGAPYDFQGAIAQLQAALREPDFDPLVREKHWGSVIFLNLMNQHDWQMDYIRHGDAQNCFRAAVSFPAKKL
jgi:serine/threonine-protein kinase RsbW